MTINYPISLDSENNLYTVHDFLSCTLATDYTIGDTSISVIGDAQVLAKFPQTGIITLTEQCSDAPLRALSFFYTSTDNATTFSGLTLLPNFIDNNKPALITSISMNIDSYSHNSQKDAIIKIEQFIGKQGEVAPSPLTGTMEARTNYLRNLVLKPKAWFSASPTLGIVPLTVTFTDQSFRLGTDGTSSMIEHIINFGDGSSPSNISISTITNSGIECPISTPIPQLTIDHTYTTPGIFNVSLEVINDFGSDSVEFPNLITARIQAPGIPTVNFSVTSNQILTQGEPAGGPYTASTPVIRSPINTLISMEVPQGLNPNTGMSYAGEWLNGNNQAIDSILTYTWELSDDLQHNTTYQTTASYSIGGYYEMVMREDTQFGAYRILEYPSAFDIVEDQNLWLWTINSSLQAQSYEFGLLSETFKIQSSVALNVNYNNSFLQNAVNSTQQIREFQRNNGITQRSMVSSGLGGTSLLWWASGRNSSASPATETIQFSEYNGFTDVYLNSVNSIYRPWNWVSFASSNNIYFILGSETTSPAPFTSPTNQQKDELSLTNLTDTSGSLVLANYLNGADELMQNEVSFDGSGNSKQGNMSVYRSCWSQNTGYLLRNEGVGIFFRLLSFYSSVGTVSDPFINLTKLPDMAGLASPEGELVALSQGIFFFNNSGSINAYNTTSGVWETSGGSPIGATNSAGFQAFQDTSVSGFSSLSNTLLIAGDGNSTAYLSYDYSNKTFLRFSSIDLTFSSVTARPSGNQWLMGIW